MMCFAGSRQASNAGEQGRETLDTFQLNLPPVLQGLRSTPATPARRATRPSIL